MGIISSLFGSGSPPPTVGGSLISATAELPAELKPFYKELLGKAQALYKTKTEEGYKPYTGPTLAKFTPEQEAAFTGIAGLQGQVAPQFEKARTFTTAGAAPITTEDITEKMSPYQQAVIDLEKAEAQKTFESKQLPEVRKAQIAAGAFGGTRGTLLEAQTLANQQKLLADIQTRGSQAAYSQALQQAAAERQRLGQAGAQLANIAPAALKTQLGEIGAYQQVGAEKQRQTQQALDEAYRQYIQEQQFPYETMQKYQAVVTGAPVQTTQFRAPAPPPPSLGQQLIGGLGTVASAYGAFGGDPLAAGAKLFGLKGGGGITDVLPIVYRANGSSVNSRIASRQRSPKDRLTFTDVLESIGLIPGGFTPTRDARGRLIEKDTDEDDSKEIDTSSLPSLISGAQAAGPGTIPGRVWPGPLGNVVIEKPGGLTEVIPTSPEIEAELADQPPPPPPAPAPELPSIQRDMPVEPQMQPQMPDTREPGGAPRLDRDYIQQQQKEYIDALSKAQGRYDERIQELGDKGKQAQWANLAQYFSRLGTASPRMGGFRGILDVAMQEAPDTIQQIKETRENIDARKEELEDKKVEGTLTIADRKLQAALTNENRELAKEERRIAKDERKYAKDQDALQHYRWNKTFIADKLAKDRSYNLALSAYDVELAKLNKPDLLKHKRLVELFDKTVLGAEFIDGEMVAIGGVPLDKLSNAIRLKGMTMFKKHIDEGADLGEAAAHTLTYVTNAIESADDDDTAVPDAGGGEIQWNQALAALSKDPTPANIKKLAEYSGETVKEIEQRLADFQ